MFRDQHAGQKHNLKIIKKSIETVEQFRYLEIIVLNVNYILEEIESR